MILFKQVSNVQTDEQEYYVESEEAGGTAEEVSSRTQSGAPSVRKVFLEHLSGHRLPEVNDNNNIINLENSDLQTENDNSFIKHNKEVFSSLAIVLPHKFSDKTGDIKFSQAHSRMVLNKGSKKLLVDPILDQTWFDPNHCVNRTDKTKIWKPKTEFPKVGSPYAPGCTNKPGSRPKDIFIVNDNLRDLLNAKKIGDVNLDPKIFPMRKNDCNIANHPFTTVDALIRAALFDSYITEELINMVMELIDGIMDGLSSSVPNFDLGPLNFIIKVLSSTSFSNQRSIANISAAFVTNKLALRNYVLNRFFVPPYTAEILKSSNFACEGVFGEFPESFKQCMESYVGPKLAAKAKNAGQFSQSSSSYGSFGAASSGFKRSAPPRVSYNSNINSNKKQRSFQVNKDSQNSQNFQTFQSFQRGGRGSRPARGRGRGGSRGRN